MTLPWGKDITVRFGSKIAPAYKGKGHAVTTGLHVRIIYSAGEGTAERSAARRAEQAPRNSTIRKASVPTDIYNHPHTQRGDCDQVHDPAHK